jgi:hypothetical protein
MHCCVSASCQRHTILFIVFLWRTLISTVIMYYLFLVVLGFELRALNLVGKCSTAWVMPLVLAYFSYFSDRILCLWSSYASRVTGITGINYHVWLILFFNFYSESIHLQMLFWEFGHWYSYVKVCLFSFCATIVRFGYQNNTEITKII